ncbi:N-acetylneuraminate lyase [Indibacter alkaliphilus LW1]|uniref:N-acetylneuraminate lyase n=1 Tax=Indibacter alkaliphilus (strain CCUG 57479 / KCTC 22604 / LW1) TaxID=1189612 RepID=S2DHH7_INDAL|nr:dihydrodipicolinate synthase family protein [Indibacter alkaliphilus]EOZ91516.1 N-acetylneuraminate lyase [Indibacter alkaliphilus LW1]
MKFSKIEGLIAATFTPFDKKDKLHLDVIPDYYGMLKRNNVGGAFICGTTGEGSALTFDEKCRLIEAWSAFSNEEFKIISMVSGTSQEEAIALAKLSAEKGLYGISMNAPYYFKPANVDALIDFIEPIAEAAPSLAVYFYHIPLLTNVYLPMLELLEKAQTSMPNFAGIKYTHNDLMDFNRCLRFEEGKFDILWGWDETFLAGLSMGAKGAVGSTYNFAAPIYNKILAAFAKGDLQTALKYQEKSIDFVSLYGKYGGGAAGKAIMKFCGLDCGSFRPPIKKLTQDDEAGLLSELNIQKFFKYSIRSIAHQD